MLIGCVMHDQRYLMWPSERLKLDSYQAASIYSMLSVKLQRFHSDSTLSLGDKMLMQSVFRWHEILCHQHEVELFFQLMEWHHSWDSILISIYLWLQSGNAHARKQWKMLCVRVWIQPYASSRRSVGCSLHMCTMRRHMAWPEFVTIRDLVNLQCKITLE